MSVLNVELYTYVDNLNFNIVPNQFFNCCIQHLWDVISKIAFKITVKLVNIVKMSTTDL